VDCEEDIEDIFAEIERLFQKINPCEREIIRNNLDLLPSIYQVYKNSIHAEEVTNMLYSISEVKEAHNNCADAFRHAYWNALNAISVPGKLAKGLADAHECWATNEKEKEMDLFNNSVGRNIGYGYSFLNIYNINDMRVLQNNIIMNLSWGNLRVIYPLNSDNELMSYSQIVGFDPCCSGFAILNRYHRIFNPKKMKLFVYYQLCWRITNLRIQLRDHTAIAIRTRRAKNLKSLI
jgi:hypothetical protein